jgi:glycerophosphoryl diester phosphodiesterase
VRRALAFGVQGIEVDVQLVDGELVIFHDTRLDRTTNGRGPLARQRFTALRELDAGLGEKIPTLREVCEAVERRAFLNIELKGRGTALPVAALLEELLGHRGWAPGDFLLSSFRVRELRRLRAIAGPEIPVGLLLARPTQFWRRTGRALRITSVHPPARLVTARFVKQAHDEGWKVFPYTVNRPEQLARIRAMGADGAFTDFPELVLAGA